MQNHRRFFVESLENRLLLAADIAFQNPLLYQDVNFDQEVSPVDTLLLSESVSKRVAD